MERLKKFEGSDSESLFGSFLINYQKTFDNFLKEITLMKQKMCESEIDVQKSFLEIDSILLKKPLTLNL